MSSNQNNRGLETIPFQIVNQSGFDAPLYIWIQGIIPEKTPNEYVYVNDLKGKPRVSTHKRQLKENPTTKGCILSRRDQTKVAWHEVPGNKTKVDPSRRDG
jgi:hypothetical protein